MWLILEWSTRVRATGFELMPSLPLSLQNSLTHRKSSVNPSDLN